MDHTMNIFLPPPQTCQCRWMQSNNNPTEAEREGISGKPSAVILQPYANVPSMKDGREMVL